MTESMFALRQMMRPRDEVKGKEEKRGGKVVETPREKMLLKMVDQKILAKFIEAGVGLPLEVIRIILQYNIHHHDLGVAYEDKDDWVQAVREYLLAVIWSEIASEFDDKFAASAFKVAIFYAHGMNTVILCPEISEVCLDNLEHHGFYGAKDLLHFRGKIGHPVFTPVVKKFLQNDRKKQLAMGNATFQANGRYYAENRPNLELAVKQGHDDACRTMYKGLKEEQDPRAIDMLIAIARRGNKGSEHEMMEIYKRSKEEVNLYWLQEVGLYWLHEAEKRCYKPAIQEVFNRMLLNDDNYANAAVTYLTDLANSDRDGGEIAMKYLYDFLRSEKSGSLRDPKKALYWHAKYFEEGTCRPVKKSNKPPKLIGNMRLVLDP